MGGVVAGKRDDPGDYRARRVGQTVWVAGSSAFVRSERLPRFAGAVQTGTASATTRGMGISCQRLLPPAWLVEWASEPDKAGPPG